MDKECNMRIAVIVATAAAMLMMPCVAAATPAQERQIERLQKANRLLSNRLVASKRIVAARDERIAAMVDASMIRNTELRDVKASLVTATAERDTARADLAAARALVTADVSTRIAAMTNDEIWALVWDAVRAFESGCPWGDSTFVSSGLSSVTFERTSSSFC